MVKNGKNLRKQRFQKKNNLQLRFILKNKLTIEEDRAYAIRNFIENF